MRLPNSYLILSQQLGIDPADIVRLDKFKFIDKEFPLDVLKIYESPFNKERVGKDNDGGYVICVDECLSYDCLIGAGINDDDSFELDFLEKNNVPCFAFDGTVDLTPSESEKITFESKNVLDLNSDKYTNLHSIIDDYESIFLKMDIEGSEYIWINSLDESHLSKFKQIAIEFHEPYEMYKWRCLQKINKTHTAVHFNANNSSAVCYHEKDGQKTKLPENFELTYISNDLIKGKLSLNTQAFPTELDQPNDPGRPVTFFNFPPFTN